MNSGDAAHPAGVVWICCMIQAKNKAQKRSNALSGNHAQQPLDIKTRCAQHRMCRIACAAFQMTAIHPRRRSIIWSMRARKKSSVAGQENITARLPDNSRYWTTNWELWVSDMTRILRMHAGCGGCSGETNYRKTSILD